MLTGEVLVNSASNRGFSLLRPSRRIHYTVIGQVLEIKFVLDAGDSLPSK